MGRICTDLIQLLLNVLSASDDSASMSDNVVSL